MKPQLTRKAVRKTRTLCSNFGEGGNLLFVSANTGGRDTSTAYLNRLDPDKCLQIYKAAKAGATSSKIQGVAYGRESIVGVTGNRHGMNQVLHVKAQDCCLPFLIMYRYNNTNSYIMWDCLRLGQSGARVADEARVLRTAAYVAPGSDRGFSARAFWSMRPKFEGKVSIINSIFELKDFKDVTKPLRAIRNLRSVLTSKSLDRYQREFNRLAKSSDIHASLNRHGIAKYSDLTPQALKVLARDSSGAAATGLLTMNLAIKPTIADAVAIMAQCSKAALDHMNDFEQYGKEGTTSHFSEQEMDHVSTEAVHPTGFAHTGRAFKVKRTATARFTYQYIPRSKSEILARYWGLTGNVEALWNMLPLSFVLDYIYTVGKALKYMDRDKNVTDLTTDYCESVKLESYAGVMVHQDPGVRSLIIDGEYIPSSSNNLHLVTGDAYTRYHRQPLEPYKGPALPKFKVPSKTQTANMLALARLFI